MEQEQEQYRHGQQEPKQKQIDSKNNYNRENIILFFGMLSVILLFLLSKRSKLLKKSFFSF
jgi:hypothetical protein